MFYPIAPWTLVLGSGSKKRAEMLTHIGWPPVVLVSQFEEKQQSGEPVQDYVCRNTQGKAMTLIQGSLLDPWLKSGAILVCADTLVHFEGQVIEKPKDFEDEIRILSSFSGKTHEVLTYLGVYLVTKDGLQKKKEGPISTLVTFRPLILNEIQDYAKTQEPYDKSGGYSIQGAASHFIEHIQGSVSSVAGLPLAQCVAWIRELINPEFGIRIVQNHR